MLAGPLSELRNLSLREVDRALWVAANDPNLASSIGRADGHGHVPTTVFF